MAGGISPGPHVNIPTNWQEFELYVFVPLQHWLRSLSSTYGAPEIGETSPTTWHEIEILFVALQHWLNGLTTSPDPPHIYLPSNWGEMEEIVGCFQHWFARL